MGQDREGAGREPARDGERAGGLTRRALLRDGSAVALAVLVAGPLQGARALAVPVTAGKPIFLTAEEMRRLRALVNAFVPGPPEDGDGGALAADCAEAIDALLGAFTFDPPRIYAGAPFSNRDGSPVDYFEDFLSLDDYEALAWRLRIEGSQGRGELEFNGPVKGWQQVYREGLGALGASFAGLPEPAREMALRTSSDPAVSALVDVAFPHTYQFMYGAPEYGGNQGLVGWKYTHWDGDMQPNGYTGRQVEEPGDGRLPAPVLPAAEQARLRAALPLAPLGASPELAHGLMIRSGHSLDALRGELASVKDFADGKLPDGP